MLQLVTAQGCTPVTERLGERERERGPLSHWPLMRRRVLTKSIGGQGEAVRTESSRLALSPSNT